MDRTTRVALECLRDAMGDTIRMLKVDPIREGHDRPIQRITLQTDSGVRCVIAKTANARERAALELLAAADVQGTPRLLAVSDDPPLVLMDDLGDGASVADRVFGDQPQRAAAAVENWARALGGVQAATVGAGVEFADRLALLQANSMAGNASAAHRHWLGQGRAVTWKTAVAQPGSEAVIADAFEGLRDGLAPIGISVDDEVYEELGALAARLDADPAAKHGPGALTPCDTCPDNNVEIDGGLALLDFECAEFRHIAWDAAYLTVPWPSCWCSWRIPDAVSVSALESWRSVIQTAVPATVAATLGDAVRDATVGWTMITTAWFLPNAYQDRPLGPGGSRRPGPRELIQHRLSVAATEASDTVLGAFAAKALDATRAAWGERTLPSAPAWR